MLPSGSGSSSAQAPTTLSDAELKVKIQAMIQNTADPADRALASAFLQRFEVKEDVSKVLVKLAKNGPSQQSLAAKLKLGKPAEFSGNPNELSNFLFSLRSYLELGGLSASQSADSDRIAVGATFLTGKALVWWRSASQKPDYQHGTKGFDDWCDDLKVQFQDVDHELRYRRKLSTLKQTKSVQGYVAAFRGIILELGSAVPNDGDLLFRFIEGLRDEVRREVYMERPTLLEDAITLAERADSALFYSRRGRQAPHHDPMDWSPGAVTVADGRGQQRSRGQGQRQERRRPPKCWRCGEVGHVKSECRRPPPPPGAPPKN